MNSLFSACNRYHPKFTAEISDKEINFLDTTVYKGVYTAKESLTSLLTSARISNLQRLFSTHVSLPVTLTGSEKVS